MKRRSLYYISPRDIKKNRSDVVAIMYACQEFSQFGLDVTLVAPRVIRQEDTYIFKGVEQTYNFKPDFKIYELFTLIKERSNRHSIDIKAAIKKLLGHLIFIYKKLQKFQNPETIIWSRCFISTVPYILFKKTGVIKSIIVFSSVTPGKKLLHKFVFRNVDKIITSVIYAKEDIIKYYKIEPSKIFLIQHHIQNYTELFKIDVDTRVDAKKKLGLNPEEKYILYAGKTGDGALHLDYYIKAASCLPDLKFIIVGVNNNSRKRYETMISEMKINNLSLVSFLPLSEYIQFVKAADILVSFYHSNSHNNKHLKPGKLGIYLMSGNPCIFSDLPSLRSLLPKDTVFFAKPDEPKNLVKEIKFIIDNPEMADEYTKNAAHFVREGSNNNTLDQIFNFIYTPN